MDTHLLAFCSYIERDVWVEERRDGWMGFSRTP